MSENAVSDEMRVSRLRSVPIRDVWGNEEKHFTPWLEKNIDILEETLGLGLSVVEREKDVGETLKADLLAKSQNGLVVIENQFGRSDHDHMGKLITYAGNLEAKTAIWICEDPRPEHVDAIDWLNTNTQSDTSFYLIKLEVFRIEDSSPAAQFSVVSAPSKEMKDAGEVKGKVAETVQKRRDFWTQLLEKSKQKTTLFSGVSPGGDGWLSTGAVGIGGVAYEYLILRKEARVQLNIATADGDKNKEIFDGLLKNRQEIETEFGESLLWERLDDRKSSRITKVVEKRGLRDAVAWAKTQDKMIDAMIRLEKALTKHISKMS